MSQLAIKGHATRGREVIQLLEMLGGKNIHRIDAIRDYCVYFVMDDKNKTISSLKLNQVLPEQFIIYSLEEFEERFPYKVGDEVIDIIQNRHVEIYKMSWSENNNCIYYDVKRQDNVGYRRSYKFLQPYKEEGVNLQELERKLDEALAKETTESLNKWLDGEPEPEPKAPILSNRYDYAEGKCGYVIPDCYEFDYIKEGFQTEIILKPKKPPYPKTYEECCKILDWNHRDYDRVGYKSNLLCKLQLLILCRDAYWEIAGEQMGLGKPWEPYDAKDRYIIRRVEDEIRKGYNISCVLEFPTSEMRDAFFENFKGLIEQCKELL